MSALAETLRALSDVLDGRKLRWFVFGAQAVAARGAPRATQDVDITVEIERSRLPELIDALEVSMAIRKRRNLAGLRFPDLGADAA